MMNDILILGSGFISTRLHEELGCRLSDRKIYTFRDAESIIREFSPRIIINSIGHIGRNVDDCELDKDKAIISNTFVPLILAEVALRNNVRLIHMSSGCIYSFDYDKDAPIKEDKVPDYFNLFYSRTKIYSELALGNLANKYPILIIRIRVPLDNRPSLKNILTKLIGYKNSIIDLPNSVTYIPDFVDALKHLIKIDARGIYNVVNKGGLKYPELLDVYKKHVPGFEYRIKDYNSLNLERTNLILSVEKLENSGFKMRDIHEVLEECVKDYLKY